MKPDNLTLDEILKLAKIISDWKELSVREESTISLLNGGCYRKIESYGGNSGGVHVEVSHDRTEWYADLIGRGLHETSDLYKISSFEGEKNLGVYNSELDLIKRESTGRKYYDCRKDNEIRQIFYSARSKYKWRAFRKFSLNMLKK